MPRNTNIELRREIRNHLFWAFSNGQCPEDVTTIGWILYRTLRSLRDVRLIEYNPPEYDPKNREWWVADENLPQEILMSVVEQIDFFVFHLAVIEDTGGTYKLLPAGKIFFWETDYQLGIKALKRYRPRFTLYFALSMILLNTLNLAYVVYNYYWGHR